MSLPLLASYDNVGDVLVLDRTPVGQSGTNTSEAVTIAAVDPANGTITLVRVRAAHAQGVTVEAGLCITEQRTLPQDRSITQVSRPQLVRLLGGAGRYSYGRRGDQALGWREADLSLLAASAVMGSAPIWQGFDVGQASTSSITGEVWVPAGLFCAYYSEVRLRYVAGFQQSALPDAIKRATANLVNSAAAAADTGPFRRFQAGGTAVERWDQSDFDPDTKLLLEPYRTRRFG